MRDVFYTLLVVWVIWRIMDSINNVQSRHGTPNRSSFADKKSETVHKQSAPKKKTIADNEGEYVDFEEVK